MITREDINKCKEDAEVDELFDQLLKERDAYREIANTLYYNEFWKDGYELIDKDAKEILKQNT